MELIEIDVVGLEPLQALFQGKADHLRAAVGESPGKECFTPTIAVGVTRIEERYAEVKGAAEEVARLFVSVITPPAGRHGPDTKADLRDAQVRLGQLAVLHDARPSARRTVSSRSVN